jgi:hypothetical protein
MQECKTTPSEEVASHHYKPSEESKLAYEQERKQR